MKKLLFIALLLLLTVSCSRKGNRASSDYVVDTTLTRYYFIEGLDSFGTYIPEHWSGDEVPTVEVAYKVVEPIIRDFLGKKEMNNQKPFRFNLVDSIWCIMSSFPEPIITKEYMDWGGPTVYVEIRKNDGRVLRFIINP